MYFRNTYSCNIASTCIKILCVVHADQKSASGLMIEEYFAAFHHRPMSLYRAQMKRPNNSMQRTQYVIMSDGLLPCKRKQF